MFQDFQFSISIQFQCILSQRSFCTTNGVKGSFCFRRISKEQYLIPSFRKFQLVVVVPGEFKIEIIQQFDLGVYRSAQVKQR
jgi:hypothetical protein